jgi:ubiquinone/menaquinone biosynthesis C-methylase UbiE
MYSRRFDETKGMRNEIWKTLCEDFFQRYIESDATVLEIASGYCEFINNIKAKRKIAVDINPSSKEHAAKDVEFIFSSSTRLQDIEDGSVDVVFTSNFFEHLTKEDIMKVIKEVHRVLTKDGSFLVLGPNIRYSYDIFWCFFDHITPLDHESMSEALEINGFRSVDVIPRFLPYSTKTNLPKSPLLLKAYLKLPWAWGVFGKQMFVHAKKLQTQVPP